MPGAASETSRPPRGEARRAWILEAALLVIAEVGPDALTYRRVAAQAGVPLAATTYWFSTKEELLRAAFERALERDLERLADLRARVGEARSSPRALARVLARTFHGRLTDSRPTALVNCGLWLEAVRRPALRALAEQWTAAYVDFYADLLRRIEPASTDDDARLLAATIEGLMVHQITLERPDQERFARLLERRFDYVSALIASAEDR